MSNQHQSNDNELQYRENLFDRINNNVQQALKPLVEKIEAKTPGHNFGQRVMNHMEGLKYQAESLGRDEFLRPRDIQLLALCLGIHDIGRVICEAERPGDRAYQHTHGTVGANFLRDKGFLSEIPPQEAQVVLDAVEQHSVKEVTLPEGSLSHSICYLMRDLDKAELLSSLKTYLSPEGALQQMDMWMLSDEAKELLQDTDAAALRSLHDFMRPILLGESIPDVSTGLSPLTTEVLEHLTRPVSDDLVKQVAQGDLLSKEQMITGYPAYMLALAANANDIYSRSVRVSIVQQDLLEPRFRYLRLVTPQVGPAIQAISNRISEDK